MPGPAAPSGGRFSGPAGLFASGRRLWLAAGAAAAGLFASRRRLWLAAGAAAAAIVLLAAITALSLPSASGKTASGHRHPVRHPPTARPGVPLQVLQVTPADGAAGVDGAAPIQVKFNEPLAAASPLPRLSPAIAGTWQRSGDTATFTPARGFRPGSRVALRIPAGAAGLQAAGGQRLAAAVTVRFKTGSLHLARLEQLFALLGYLPVTWTPALGTAQPPLTDARAQLSAAYSPPQGSYAWPGGYPAQLHQLWQPGGGSMVLHGAVIAFEADHGMVMDGVIGPEVWQAMFRVLALGQRSQHGYTYALASQKLPEMLTIWHNGAVILRHVANTGIGVAPTTIGTAPVYLRYQYQIMRGRNPDGSKYADPVAWVAYFRGGEAIHYFPRYSYGSPQSLGCVELPWGPAKKIWPYLTFGTLVTVTGP